MIRFLQLPDDEKRNIYQEVSNKVGVPPQAVEKDIWVTLMLKVIFSSELAPHFIFKGGTSLSKAFNLINRFSEDIDLGIDRRYLGFNGDLNKGQIRKLRRAGHSFVSHEFKEVLKKQLDGLGVNKSLYELIVENTRVSDQDPETILVKYKSIYEENEIPYLQTNVKIEVSARTLIEPYRKIELQSWVDKEYPGANFTESPFVISATDPQKTLIEKLILLHEEFKKPTEKIRYLRMSRHFYDIGQILKTDFGKEALVNHRLFESVIAHRRVLTPSRNTNYDMLTIKSLEIVPSEKLMNEFKSDYKVMQESMIRGVTMEFDELLNEIVSTLNRS